MAVSTQSRLSLPKLPKREKTAIPRSQAERLWLVGGGLVALVMFLVGYFFFISPQRSETSDVNSQVATTRDQNTVLEHRIAALREQNKNLAKYQVDLQNARLALPATSGISDFLRSLQSLGNATLTNVTSLAVGVPTDVSALAAGEPSPAASANAADSTATTAPQATVPAAGASAIYALPITATVVGTPSALAKFLDQLQEVQPRAVLVTQITQTTGSAVGTASAPTGKTAIQLTMEAFVAPSSPAESASLSAASH